MISDQVFEHVQDQVRAFEELLRITRPGGHGLHIIPARYAPIRGISSFHSAGCSSIAGGTNCGLRSESAINTKGTVRR